LTELGADSSALLRIPLFLGLLIAVRGVPALLARRELPGRELVAAALLQSTSLSFIVVATQIGVGIGELRPVNAASLVTAGMLSVLFFPATALVLLGRRDRAVDHPGPVDLDAPGGPDGPGDPDERLSEASGP
jgi:Kef-type K+ transport system membrane component KefB